MSNKAKVATIRELSIPVYTDFGEKDVVDLSLSELVRTGRVTVSKDDEGRDVYRLVRS